jgi:hypothetical protein
MEAIQAVFFSKDRVVGIRREATQAVFFSNDRVVRIRCGA